MSIFNNLKKWNTNKKCFPIHIFKNNPYIRLYVTWVWNPKKGYWGFLAWETYE